MRGPGKRVALVAMLGTTVSLGVLAAAQSGPEPSRRVNERLHALEREAADLNAREKTLVTELRKLELDRQIRIEELAGVEREMTTIQSRIAEAQAKADALRQAASASSPDAAERVVRLYKMGRVGHWRLLLDVDDVRAVGRAYRTAAALTQIDRRRIEEHHATVEALESERRTLEARSRELAQVQERAAAARASVDRAVAARAAMLRSIDARQDLTARLADELREAQQKLDAQLRAGRAGGALPVQLFKGDIPWPAEGIIIGRFGRHRNPSTGAETMRNGIEISLREGTTVSSVHEGVVTYSAPFSGYGHLVIVEHGTGAHSLYGHLASATVNKGDRVESGTRVGLSGRNMGGNPALYFELRIDGKPVDPLQWMRK